MAEQNKKEPVILTSIKIALPWGWMIFCRFFERWSLNCGSIFGITIRVHILNILWLGLVYYYLSDFNLMQKGIFILSIIFSLLSHEISHCLVARYFRNVVIGIVIMLPLGFVALIDLKEDKPLKALAITLAGPMVNLLTAFAISLLPLLISTQIFYHMYFYHFYLRFLLEGIFMTSLIIGIFNLIPLYPMDGGRVVKDLMLLCKVSNKSANILTLGLAVVSFICLILFSIKTSNIMLSLIGIIMITISIYEFVSGDDDSISSDLPIPDCNKGCREAIIEGGVQ